MLRGIEEYFSTKCLVLFISSMYLNHLWHLGGYPKEIFEALVIPSLVPPPFGTETVCNFSNLPFLPRYLIAFVSECSIQMSTPTAVFALTSLTAVGRQHMMSQLFWYFHLVKIMLTTIAEEINFTTAITIT